jgi:hypothetical protein
MSMPAPTTNRVELPQEIELQRIVSLAQASELSGLSEDTLRRRHADKILKLSPRRNGMRVRDALMLPAPPNA